jgi:hypothetical protein
MEATFRAAICRIYAQLKNRITSLANSAGAVSMALCGWPGKTKIRLLGSRA